MTGDGRGHFRRAAPWVAVFLLALSLRLAGIDWALHGADRARSFHPDERQVSSALSPMEPRRLDLHPGWMINPPFYYCLVGALIAADPTVPAPFGLTFDEWREAPAALHAAWTLRGRIVSALAGAVAVLLAGLIALSLGRGAGYGAAFLLAVNPNHVIQSHYAAVDLTASTVSLAAVYFALRFASRKSTAALALAWGFAGLATATKYISIVVIAAPLYAILADAES